MSVSALIVAYFFGRGFLREGSFDLLVLGGGSVILGLGFLISQILGSRPLGGPNQLVGISGMTFLLSGIFFGAYATTSLAGKTKTLGRRKAAVALEYSVGIVSILAIVLVFETSLAPSFFQGGIGPTLLRQQVLGTATGLFSYTAIVLVRSYRKSGETILYWFSLGLASISVGFLSAFLGKVPGGLFSWLGRISVALGGVYFIIAIVEAYGIRARD